MNFGRIICFLKGHKRGKLIYADLRSGLRNFACPRCGNRTTYKAKPPKVESTPADGSPHFQELA